MRILLPLRYHLTMAGLTTVYLPVTAVSSIAARTRCCVVSGLTVRRTQMCVIG
jgi:hypothetical protein